MELFASPLDVGTRSARLVLLLIPADDFPLNPWFFGSTQRMAPATCQCTIVKHPSLGDDPSRFGPLSLCCWKCDEVCFNA